MAKGKDQHPQQIQNKPLDLNAANRKQSNVGQSLDKSGLINSKTSYSKDKVVISQ